MICLKASFDTEALAKRRLKEIQKNRHKNPKPVRVYECPVCSKWHLTSIKKSEYQNGRSKSKKPKEYKQQAISMNEILQRKQQLEKQINKSI